MLDRGAGDGPYYDDLRETFRLTGEGYAMAAERDEDAYADDEDAGE